MIKRWMALMVLSTGFGCGGGSGSGESQAQAPAQPMLELLAGALGGEGNADGVATAARFHQPKGVATDGKNLFVADMRNHTIRRIDLSTATVTLLAGSPGSRGSADGVGEAARFYLPSGIATDGTNLFVADTYNHTVRKIHIATRTVTTMAGLAGAQGNAEGTESSARFRFPDGVATDGKEVFVADSSNCKIRRIDIATRTVTTLAGSGTPGHNDEPGTSARFRYPSGVATDGTNVFVADTYNQTIRKIVIGSAQVTTLVGSPGLTGFDDGTGPGARFWSPLALATNGQQVFVADTYADTIRRVDITTREVTTLAGLGGTPGSADGTKSTARLDHPAGIATSGTELFVADTFNDALRKVAIESGQVSTLAGVAESSGSADGTVARFDYPLGIATDGTSVFVADQDNHTIRRIQIATGMVTTMAGKAGDAGSTDGSTMEARFSYPADVATDGTSVFVADSGNCTIRRVDIQSGNVTTLAGLAETPGSQDGKGTGATFNYPFGIATDGTSVFVADSSNSAIRRIDIQSGWVTTLAGTPGVDGSDDGTGSAAKFNYPTGLATDGARLFVADTDNHTIRQIVIATAKVTTLAGTSGIPGTADGSGESAKFYEPRAVATDGTSVYVADSGNFTIRKIAIDARAVTTVAGTAGVAAVELAPLPGRLNYVAGIALGSKELFVSVPVENSILRMPLP